MPSAFEAAMDHVLRFEGGYVNDPQDPGGETIYGISRRHHPEAWADGKPTKADAKALYRRVYWEGCRCDELHPAIAVMVFDTAINQGRKDAVRFLQTAAGARVDSIIGPQTIKAASMCEPARLLQAFAVERAYDYALLDHLDDRYGRGWMRRLFACYEVAQSLFAQATFNKERSAV